MNYIIELLLFCTSKYNLKKNYILSIFVKKNFKYFKQIYKYFVVDKTFIIVILNFDKTCCSKYLDIVGTLFQFEKTKLVIHRNTCEDICMLC